jgi:hypothetical protein
MIRIRNPFRTLGPIEMLSKQLNSAECDRIEWKAVEEDAAFTVKKLDARIARIREELKAITKNEDQPK